MAQPTTQTFANHARVVPAYHYVAFFILAINVLWTAYRAVRMFSPDTAIAFLVSIALIILFLYARQFAITAQDRIIRLEMRLRMQKLLPSDLQPRITDFTVGQLIALRFASDEELPDLARKVLAGNITSRKEIKKLIRNWIPDFLRV